MGDCNKKRTIANRMKQNRYIKKRKKHKMTLWNQAVLFVALCWVIPMCSMMFIINYYSNGMINEQIHLTNELEIDESIKVVEEAITQAINAINQPVLDKRLRTIYEESNFGEKSAYLYQGTSDYLTTNYRYNSYITSTVVSYHHSDSLNYHMDSNRATSKSILGKNKAKQLIFALKEQRMDLDTQVLIFISEGELFLARNLVRGNFEPYATMLMKLNKEAIFQNLFAHSYINIIHFDVEEILENVGEGSFVFKLKEYQEGSYVQDMEIIYRENELNGNILSYKIYKDSNNLMEGFYKMQNILIRLLICLVPFVFIIIFLFYENFVTPIHYLVSGMRKVSKGELGYQITQEQRGEEFAYLKDKFNEMSTNMKVQFEYQYEEQLALRDAQIRALQSQINPHFMNNTLEVINWEIRLGENHNASKMLEAFSTMMNAAVSRSDSSLITLKEELSYVDAYLYIASVRMGKKLKVIREIDEALLEHQVPRLLLQPIVENAIEHGISYRDEGTLEIKISEDIEYIIIEIENDKRLSNQDIEKIENILQDTSIKEHRGEHISVGVKNISQRLQLLYGFDYQFTIINTNENHTLATVKIPKIIKTE